MAGTTNPKKPGKNGGGGQGSPTDIIPVGLDNATASNLRDALTTALTQSGGGGQGSPTDITVWLDDATAKVLLSALTVALGKPTSGKKTKKVK